MFRKVQEALKNATYFFMQRFANYGGFIFLRQGEERLANQKKI